MTSKSDMFNIDNNPFIVHSKEIFGEFNGKNFSTINIQNHMTSTCLLIDAVTDQLRQYSMIIGGLLAENEYLKKENKELKKQNDQIIPHKETKKFPIQLKKENSKKNLKHFFEKSKNINKSQIFKSSKNGAMEEESRYERKPFCFKQVEKAEKKNPKKECEICSGMFKELNRNRNKKIQLENFCRHQNEDFDQNDKIMKIYDRSDSIFFKDFRDRTQKNRFNKFS